MTGPAAERREDEFRHGAFACRLVLPRSSEDLFDQAAFDADERLPYWADLWPAAKRLARWVLDEPRLPEAAIDLGCGVGLTTMALLHRGVRTTATDYEPEALRYVVENAARNGLPTPEVRCLDWRERPDDLVAPLVVGADLLYEKRNAEALAALLPTILARGGRALLADPKRPWRHHFADALASRGFRVRERAAGDEAGSQGKPVPIVFLEVVAASAEVR